MKIAILGTAPSSRYLAPFDNDEWQIWACSPCLDLEKQTFCELPRIDRFFELHKFDGPELRTKLNEQQVGMYRTWLKSLDIPVVAQDEDVGQPYPLQEVTERFGKYLTNTISYMIALAIFEGATHISLYGVDMAAEEEFGAQRPSCEWWLGLARGMGIEVFIPDQSDLLKTEYLYAFEGAGALKIKLNCREKELAQRLSQAKQEAELSGRYHAAASAAADEVDQLKHLLNGEGTPELLAKMDERRERAAGDANKAQSAAKEAHEKMIAIMGAQEDCKYFKQWI